MKILRRIIGKILELLSRLTLPAKQLRSPENKQQIAGKLSQLSIYQFELCPFCIKVRRQMHKLDLDIKLIDAKDPKYGEELKAGGGKIQVPCLKIQNEDGTFQWMYESSDINNYLEQQFPV